jgi:hypothetical protein
MVKSTDLDLLPPPLIVCVILDKLLYSHGSEFSSCEIQVFIIPLASFLLSLP